MACLAQQHPQQLIGAGTVLNPALVREVHAAGASGFGIGSALYAHGKTAQEVATCAGEFIQAWKQSP